MFGMILDLQDHFERIGEVQFYAIKHSIITYKNVSQSVDKFFRKETSWANLGRYDGCDF